MTNLPIEHNRAQTEEKNPPPYDVDYNTPQQRHGVLHGDSTGGLRKYLRPLIDAPMIPQRLPLEPVDVLPRHFSTCISS